MRNLQEYIADTNPTNANSNLRVLSSQVVSNGLRLTWAGGSQARQYLQRSPSMAATSVWINLFTNQPPTAVTNSFVDTAWTNKVFFYRIKAER
jgi:hypothetical protein